MVRSIFKLFGFVLFGIALFAGAFLLSSRLYCEQLSRPTDDLEWLRIEFQLSPAEMDRVRDLHDGYLPICHGYCAQIAEEKYALNKLVVAGQGTSEQAVNCLTEIAQLRAQCQAAMLQHFEEVSRLMRSDQGQRYLEEMHRITLHSHEQIEDSMSGSQGDGHVHH